MNLNFKNIELVYFVGIGGIGMSALSRYFKVHNKKVVGYDKTPTDLTSELIAEGVDVHFSDDPEFAKRTTQDIKDRVLIVYTPAIPKDHAELNFFQQNGFTVLKRSEVLAEITRNHFTIAVAGTHGKTTTSSMITHILHSSGINCIAFLGGISKNLDSNFLMPAGNEKAVVVVEADEYDRSFLKLHPDISIITSMDPDHLDIYGDAQQMVDSYRQFAAQSKMLFARKGLPLEREQKTYAVSNGSDYSASEIRVANHQFYFTWNNRTTSIKDMAIQMPGKHNIENAVAAIAVARQLSIPEEKIREAIQSYTGVKRRFDYQIKSDQLVYIDDYAHHPEELRACISAVKELYPGKKITGIFQPHLFSRTRDFADEFAEVLSMPDELILLDIYPAREKPIPGVTSQIIFDKVTTHKTMCTKDEVLQELQERKLEVLLTLGAGDIDQLVKPIKQLLSK